MEVNADFSELLALPGWALAALGVLAVVQVALAVYALVVLFRTPEERLLMGKRWPWVLIIAFVNFIGAVVFLAAGRTPAQAPDPLSEDPHAAPASDRAGRAADVLYGPRDGAGS